MENALTLFVGTFTTLLAVINPLESLPIFLKLLAGQDEAAHQKVALQSCLYATLLTFELTKTKADPEKSLRENLIEIGEAIVLSLSAVATAWCGYQAAMWDGRHESLYAVSARLWVEAAIAITEGGQQRLLDVLTFNSWIQAKEAKNEELTANCERRFSAE